METEKGITKASMREGRLKKGAKVCLVVLSLYIVGQLVTVYQTRYQLVSPLIPEKIIWDINKQFIFKALVASVMFLIALILYFFERHLLVIILAAITLITCRYIYI